MLHECTDDWVKCSDFFYKLAMYHVALEKCKPGTQEIKEGDEISVEDTGNQRREEGTPKPKRLRSEGDALDDSKADGEHKANFTTPKKVSAAVYEKISESVCKQCGSQTSSKKYSKGPRKGEPMWLKGLCNKCFQSKREINKVASRLVQC